MSNSYKVMGDFLQRHAYENVWCTPNQDKQVILQPARLTPANGVRNKITVMWRVHKLPDLTSRFHVYQIGQIHPMLLGLLPKMGQWLSVADVCALESLIVDLYTEKGIQIHRSQAWYMVTPEKNLVVAVKIPNKSRVSIDLNSEDLHMRLYTNAYFNSIRADGADDVIHVEGGLVGSNQDILNLQQQVTLWRQKPTGYVYCFVNGFAVDKIDLITTKVGDLMEFVYDGSIKKTVTFNVSDLMQFTSTLDQVYKYLLHYEEASDVIDYIDDVDVFLLKPGTGDRFKGIYFHKNNEKALRMVTHKDYSIPVMTLNFFTQAVAELGSNVDNLRIKLHIRKSGYQRPLVLEHNRIAQLYALNPEDTYRAMVGIDATVSVWDAAALEESGYCALMRADLGDIGKDDVQKAYGYNAVSKLIGDTPARVKVMGSMRYVDVPVGLQGCCTAYEYDSDGLLLGWYNHSVGSVYVCQHPTADLVEMVFGLSGESFESWWGNMTLPIDPSFNYRFYTCGRSAGIIDNNWVDKTESNEYAIANNLASWLINPVNTYPMVRSNKRHITYQLNFFAIDGLLTFSLREWSADIAAYRVLGIPPGKIEIFLNKKSLIEGLDYIVTFPRITIVNKEYLDDPLNKAQEIVVRLTGFAQVEEGVMTHEKVFDVGFVKYGVLSKNNRFDVREDKVNRIIVDGALYRYDELEYAEEDFDIHVTDARNGAPYAITDIVVPMNDYLQTEQGVRDITYDLRHRSQLVDKEISDYLTLKIPEVQPEEPSAIAQRYKIVSPFFLKLVYDLISGALWEDKFIEHYSDNYVREVCASYEYLLEFDPITEGRTPDENFVVIHPHNLDHYLDMGVYQLKFLNRAVAIYGRGKIELSSHIRVELFGEAA